jgi:hypothetical protein
MRTNLKTTLGFIYALVIGCIIYITVTTNYAMDIDGFKFNRVDNMPKETYHKLTDENKDGIYETVIVVYIRNDEPSIVARFWADEPRGDAYWLGVDLDNNDSIDFTIFDADGDGYLNTDTINCLENCASLKQKLDEIKKGIFRLDTRI